MPGRKLCQRGARTPGLSPPPPRVRVGLVAAAGSRLSSARVDVSSSIAAADSASGQTPPSPLAPAWRTSRAPAAKLAQVSSRQSASRMDMDVILGRAARGPAAASYLRMLAGLGKLHDAAPQ